MNVVQNAAEPPWERYTEQSSYTNAASCEKARAKTFARERTSVARQTIDKQAIVEAAYCMASENGLSSLGIREVATACGVSVGTIYNHVASKGGLIAEVVAMFWRNSLAAAACNPLEDEDFVEYVERVYEAMRNALAAFRSDWLPEIRAMMLRGEAVGHEREKQVFAHMGDGLTRVLESDPNADVGRLEGLAPEDVSGFVLDSMLSALSEGASDCRVLASLLRASLYDSRR